MPDVPSAAPIDPFVHLPVLRDRLTPAEQSALRLTAEALGVWDERARAEGRPHDWRLPDEHLNEAAHGYLFGGWFTMGMLLTLPMVLVGLTLMLMAYKRREPSGNFAAVPQPA